MGIMQIIDWCWEFFGADWLKSASGAYAEELQNKDMVSNVKGLSHVNLEKF